MDENGWDYIGKWIIRTYFIIYTITQSQNVNYIGIPHLLMSPSNKNPTIF